MNYLIVGNGGREHAILKSLTKNNNNNDNNNDKFFYFGEYDNAGMIQNAERINIIDKDNLKKYDINTIIVGPEKYLRDGVVDTFEEWGYNCIGPKKILGQIETSKIFARQFLDKYNMNICNPKYKIYNSNSLFDPQNYINFFPNSTF